eukprot:8742962-Lingulodinium_polyedra.AAC.1
MPIDFLADFSSDSSEVDPDPDPADIAVADIAAQGPEAIHAEAVPAQEVSPAALQLVPVQPQLPQPPPPAAAAVPADGADVLAAL